jgi:hypothetical protein
MRAAKDSLETTVIGPLGPCIAVVFYDLASDPTLFAGEGDTQFEVYRAMRAAVEALPTPAWSEVRGPALQVSHFHQRLGLQGAAHGSSAPGRTDSGWRTWPRSC